MKFIKLFEELSPEIYINAGNKLKAKNQKGRGDNLKKYGETLIKPITDNEFNYSIFCNDFVKDEIVNCKFIEFECLFCGENEEDASFEELIEDDYSLYYIIIPKFETIDGEMLIPFDMCVYLYSKVRGKNRDRILNLDIKLQHTQTDSDFSSGVFADRRSALKFKREVLNRVLDDTAKFRVQDVVSFLDKPSNDLELIYDIFNKIDIHYLYGDSIDSIGNNKISILKK